jgi:hypothetical protein
MNTLKQFHITYKAKRWLNSRFKTAVNQCFALKLFCVFHVRKINLCLLKLLLTIIRPAPCFCG